jgi:hypothetical protein
MKRTGARVLAEAIFILHTALMAVLLVGWLLPEPYYYIYLAVLSVTFLTQIIWRYCILTAWEFYFRKMLDPTINDTPYYLTFYTHKMFPKLVTDAFVDRISLIFMALSIAFAALHLSGNL